MIYPHTELHFINEKIGYGVVATRFIPKGTITWVGDPLDQVLGPERDLQMPDMLVSQVERYSFRDAQGQRILCWDHARFVNHSCNANCLSAGFDFELAIRDIEPGEELTDDYGTLNIESSFECLCGSVRCREVIHPDDLLRYSRAWDITVHESLPYLSQVRQPLWPLIQDKQKLEQVLAGEHPLTSLVTHYCGSKNHDAQLNT
jgi:hypothetical protein